jgi:hypothetical protein
MLAQRYKAQHNYKNGNLSSVMKTVVKLLIVTLSSVISSAEVFTISAHASDTISLLTEKHAERERDREEEKEKENDGARIRE